MTRESYVVPVPYAGIRLGPLRPSTIICACVINISVVRVQKCDGRFVSQNGQVKGEFRSASNTKRVAINSSGIRNLRNLALPDSIYLLANLASTNLQKSLNHPEMDPFRPFVLLVCRPSRCTTIPILILQFVLSVLRVSSELSNLPIDRAIEKWNGYGE